MRALPLPGRRATRMRRVLEPRPWSRGTAEWRRHGIGRHPRGPTSLRPRAYRRYQEATRRAPRRRESAAAVRKGAQRGDQKGGGGASWRSPAAPVCPTGRSAKGSSGTYGTEPAVTEPAVDVPASIGRVAYDGNGNSATRGTGSCGGATTIVPGLASGA